MSAERIRAFVQKEYIEPVRSKGEKEVVIRAGTVHDRMNLGNLQPLVCDTLRGRMLQDQCRVSLVNEQWGPDVHQRHAKNIWFTYKILGP